MKVQTGAGDFEEAQEDDKKERAGFSKSLYSKLFPLEVQW